MASSGHETSWEHTIYRATLSTVAELVQYNILDVYEYYTVWGLVFGPVSK